MNTDSKLKRFVILLEKAPFIAFFESPNYINMSPPLRALGIVDGESIKSVIEIKENTDLRVVISDTNKLPDPLAYKIVEALAAALPSYPYFDIEEFISPKWQKDIAWQNVDNKPETESETHEFTITVNRITHELGLVYNSDLEGRTDSYDGVIDLSSVNITVPFPKALLKECTADIYEIIKITSINREPETIAKSRYMSVMDTGYNIFNWVNLKKIAKDLIAVIKGAGITIEE